jgi:hypothetical protein
VSNLELAQPVAAGATSQAQGRDDKPRDDLLAHVEGFFVVHLALVRGASHRTVRAHGDALRLLFVFVTERTRRSVASLSLDDVCATA